jgi:hypothetical protein
MGNAMDGSKQLLVPEIFKAPQLGILKHSATGCRISGDNGLDPSQTYQPTMDQLPTFALFVVPHIDNSIT